MMKGYFIIILFLFGCFDLKASCEDWQLSPSTLMKKDIKQQDTGMCYAHRDSKAMEYFHQSFGISLKEPSILELATTFHRKLLFMKQVFSKYQFTDYKKGESILDWGHACEGVNYILEHGICEKSIYSSSSYHLIYNIIRNMAGINLKFCDDCEPGILEFSNENKKMFSETFIGMTKKEIASDPDLDEKERFELTALAEKLFSNKRKVNFPKEVKAIERKVKRHCRNSKREKIYEGYVCKDDFFPTMFSAENYKEKTYQHLMKSLADRNGQPIMVNLCSANLSSSTDLEKLNFSQTIGRAMCGPHAVLITGAQKKGDRCEVLIEDNYPGVCDQEKMRWVRCEKDSKGAMTGRYWIDTKKLAPILISVSKIEKQ